MGGALWNADLDSVYQTLSVGSYISLNGDEGNLEVGQTVRGLLLH